MALKDSETLNPQSRPTHLATYRRRSNKVTTDPMHSDKYISLFLSCYLEASLKTVVIILYDNSQDFLFIRSDINPSLVDMIIPKSLVILATALTATATKVHNKFGLNGWIQDHNGQNHYLAEGGSVTISGGWGFFWTNNYSGITGCNVKNSAAFSWPSGYGGMLIMMRSLSILVSL
jgi:hypothetical protein